ncbi:copper homeostasis protein CutC [Rossellomorea sp. BNER]|uniref:copper homeostasis protein CutC n=1 Tax=Rossellomorea sp. BNER TaxID=2962031 RepID=UPI003AF2ABF7|nr:copper homeostasis protein CutC [Rossellomorea sp. BNER]
MSDLEIIVLNEEDARVAEASGADRLELVTAISEGGLTPGYDVIEKVVNSVTIPVQVMVRPHSNSFVYSETDVRQMRKDIEIVKQLGANGIVFGSLTEKGELNTPLLRKIIEFSEGLSVTFHRAIDEANDPVSLYKQLKSFQIKIDRVLTSGGAANVSLGLQKLQAMLKYGGPTIMPGSGLTLDNIEEIHGELKAKEYHFGSGVRKQSHFQCGIEPKKIEEIKRIISKR